MTPQTTLVKRILVTAALVVVAGAGAASPALAQGTSGAVDRPQDNHAGVEPQDIHIT
ncbi:hypothetical protein AB0O07_16800 [Streptomyces sp. NPDC093085]|uniref:hypothetical protein n=1 Tax=Streptomyces sp. NPDC093085 TaxID=3155068 RepID=UPI00344AB936